MKDEKMVIFCELYFIYCAKEVSINGHNIFLHVNKKTQEFLLFFFIFH